MLNTLILSPYQLFIFLPELWLSTTVLILLVYVVLPKTRTLGQWAQLQDIDNLSIGILGITLILIMTQFQYVAYNENENIVLWANNGLIKVDAMVCFIKFICILGGLLVIWISKEYYAQEKLATTGHNILILLALLGITLLVSSNDLLALYLAMELQSLSFYTLATLKRDDESSTEAGLKYFILGALSSGIFLFGVSLIYGLTGLTNYDSLNLFIFNLGTGLEQIYPIGGLLIGILFIGIAFLFKLAAAPFHMWAPDVYQGSPTSITALFAIVPKLAIFGVLIKLYLDTFLGLMIQWQPLIIFCSIASMIIGSLGALNQSLIKRLLAYSAISHIGYILIAFASGTHTSLQALLVYMTIYMIMSIQSFSIILSLRKKLNGKSVNYLIEFVSLSRTQPILGITFAISLLSLAGVPPLAGFFSKWLVFSSAIQSHFYLLAIIGVLTSVLASVYYLRIIINMFARFNSPFKTYNSNNTPISNINRLNPTGGIFTLNVLFDTLNPYIIIDRPKSLILGWTTFLILFILFFPTPLLLICHEVALNFYM